MKDKIIQEVREMGKITPEVNRERVKKSMEKIDRINVYLPEGTKERIEALGYKYSAFAKNAILEAIEKHERMKKK